MTLLRAFDTSLSTAQVSFLAWLCIIVDLMIIVRFWVWNSAFLERGSFRIRYLFTFCVFVMMKVAMVMFSYCIKRWVPVLMGARLKSSVMILLSINGATTFW